MKMMYCLFLYVTDGDTYGYDELVGVYSEMALAEKAQIEQADPDRYHIEEWELDLDPEEES